MIRLFDTALGQVRDLELREPGKVSMYVCGPTVYGDAHIGHGRFNLVWDILRRYLMWCGYEVKYVSNITDIEDKIIRRSHEEGREIDEIVRTYEKAWWENMDGLGILPPDHGPRATEYVAQMVDYIAGLVDSGAAYETSDGVYLSVESVPGYGLLARQTVESLRAGAGGRAVLGEEKRNPLDFALWKKAKPGEPTWPSPWGDGRPGWHIECTVMALALLDDDFDLHGGGIDLAFPHHENERAQAVAGHRKFARHWVHNGMVEQDGQKMARSVGNVVSLGDLIREHDPRAYRLLVLRAHYRSPLDVTPTTLADAEAGLARLDAFARRFGAITPARWDEPILGPFRAAMDDDLKTPQATAILFDFVRKANADDDRDAAAAAKAICEAVGLELRLDDEIDAETAALVVALDAARARKDWPEADRIRAELQARGWVVETTKDGTRIHR